MCDIEFSFLDVDELVMMASDLLDQFRDRGMPDTIHRKVLEKTFDANNLEKLRDRGRIQHRHDACSSDSDPPQKTTCRVVSFF